MEDSNKRIVLLFTLQEINPAEGISKKILAEQKAFESNGFKCLLGRIVQNSNGCFEYKIGEQTIIKYGSGIFAKFGKLYRYRNILSWIKTHKEKIDLIYIRYTHFSNHWYCRFIDKLHELGLKIAVEIPTYPYDKEYEGAGWKSKLLHFEEKLTRKRLVKNIDRIVTFSNDDVIWNRPTIKINNAVDLASIPLRQPNEPVQNQLQLIGVANLMFWHGYDRIIEALKKYYETPRETEVFFHIVGGNPGGETYDQLQDLVQKYNLSKHVVFHGVKSGRELDELFNSADIAVGCLGCHRKGLKQVQSIKNVEYAARGIPFIYSETNPLFDEVPYVYKISGDEKPIDIQSIIDFHNANKYPTTAMRTSIYHLTWNNQIKIILEELDIS